MSGGGGGGGGWAAPHAARRLERAKQGRTGADPDSISSFARSGRLLLLLLGEASVKELRVRAVRQGGPGGQVHGTPAGTGPQQLVVGPAQALVPYHLAGFLLPPSEGDGAGFPVVPRGVGHPHVTDVAHHELGGEGVLGDEEDGTLRVHVQGDASLSVGTVVHLRYVVVYMYVIMHVTYMYKHVKCTEGKVHCVKNKHTSHPTDTHEHVKA